MRKPPSIPYVFLKVLAPSEFREFFLGDLEEEFQTIASGQDEKDANRWFWKQSIKSIFPLLRLFAHKNLQVSIIRIAAIFSVLLPVIFTSPLKKYSANLLFN